MKVKVKGLVFAGLAAVIFAGNAMAAAGDLDPTVNPTHVTAKSYVDRVVNTRHPLIDSEHKLSAELVDGVASDSELSALEERVDTAEDNITGLQNAKENLSNKVTSGLVSTDASGKITSVGTGNAANYASTGAISSDLTKVKGAIELKQDALTTAQQDAVNSGITSTKVSQYDNYATSKQDKSDSTATAGHYIVAGSNVGENLKRLDDQVNANETAIGTINSNIGTVPAGSTVMEEIAAAQSAATYDDTALAGRVSANETAIGTINNSAPMNSGITAAKVSTYDAYATNKQDKSDSNVTTAGTYIQTGTDVAANLTALDTQVKANADSITDIKGGSVMTSGINSGLVTQIGTNASNITALQNGKEDKGNKTTTGLITTDNDGNITAVAAGSATAYASTSAISSDLTKVKDAITAANTVASGLDGRLDTAESDIADLQAADTTLQTNIDGKQDLSTADYQMGKQGGGWTTMSPAQQNALNSGIVASTCSANAPCAWINNAWVPIQQ